MAEEQAKSADAGAVKPKRKLPMTAILIGGITVAQSAGFFVALKFFGSSPAPSYGEGSAAATAPAAENPEGESGGGHGEADKKEGGAKKDAGESGGHGESKPGDAKGEGHGEAKREEPKGGGHGEAGKKEGGTKKDAGESGGHGGKNYVDTEGDSAAESAFAEVPVLTRFRAPNHKSGRTFVYDFDVKAVVQSNRKADMEALVTERGGEIADRVAQAIRAADARMLAEDDLQTLRMQLRGVLTQITGDEKLVKKVLIPKFVPMRAD